MTTINNKYVSKYKGLPWQLSGKESACQDRFDTWVGKIPWRRKWQPTLVFLPGKFHGQRSPVGYTPWVCKRIRHDWATVYVHTQTFAKWLFSEMNLWLPELIITLVKKERVGGVRKEGMEEENGAGREKSDTRKCCIKYTSLWHKNENVINFPC